MLPGCRSEPGSGTAGTLLPSVSTPSWSPRGGGGWSSRRLEPGLGGHLEGQLPASPHTLGLLAGHHWAGRGHLDGRHPKGAGIKVSDISVPPPEAAGCGGHKPRNKNLGSLRSRPMWLSLPGTWRALRFWSPWPGLFTQCSDVLRLQPWGGGRTRVMTPSHSTAPAPASSLPAEGSHALSLSPVP